ncbi:cuticle protein 19.8 [Musca vetustissima]|uniref:cuticle protein 19.8 n=1 Tax=Musca vetustissima TaxID=27455 RepID=UPI002AB6D608|nr:cuticle protein 19.8 [Musca vetustissima]
MKSFAVAAVASTLAISANAGLAPVAAPYTTFGAVPYAAPYAAGPYTAAPYFAAPAAYSAPLVTKTFAAAPAFAAPAAVYSAAPAPYVAAPIAKTYAAAPLVAKTFAAPAPVVAAAPAPVVAAAPAPVVAKAVAAPLAAPVVAKAAVVEPEIVDAHPQYQFAYNVQDTLTGDSKTQEETRDGGVVRGSYSLIEPDGSRRTVNYYADDINGFNAVVQKDVPVAAAAPVVAAPAPVVAKTTFAAPIVA